MLSKEMSQLGICKATWNFHESGHRKGVPDGVGGALKRTANNIVLHGHAITDAASIICKIQEQDTSVYLYEIHENEILNNSFDAKLKPITGTYTIHQIKTQKLGELLYGDVSCLCEEEEYIQGINGNLVKLLRTIKLENLQKLPELRREG